MRTNKAKNRSRLIQAANGLIPCDLTIQNVQFFNVFTGEIYPAEVDILDGFVVRVREKGTEALMESKSLYDGNNNYLIPGFIDTHMHVESTMMIPENLSRAILPWGTTTICTDPHEIGNVLGIDGVKYMLENAKKSALRQYVLAPSCVPAVPGLESTGASFGAKEVGELLDMDDVVGIAEIMDFVGVIMDNERMHSIVDEGMKRGMYLQGHSPFITGKDVAAYRLGGPVSCHESATAAEVQEKLRAGFHINLRASSIVDNLSTLIDGCRNHPWRDFVSICTDDVHAHDLLSTGHINRVVRKAIESGLDAREVIKMATLNAAREYKFDDLGAIAPGYIADIQLVKELDGTCPEAVFVEGKLIAEKGKYLGEDQYDDSLTFSNTMNLPQITSSDDLRMVVPQGYEKETIAVNVIVPTDFNPVLKTTEVMELPVRDGAVDISDYPELAFYLVANRFGTGDTTIAVYKHLGLKEGAFASTVSHDSHNFTVVYRDIESAYKTVETLRECGGGMCVANGEIKATLPLEVAGLMSNKTCEEIAEVINTTQSELAKISEGMALLSTSILALTALPCIITTDKGVINGLTQSFVPVFDIK